MAKCEYDSFNTLAIINDPDLLSESFQKILSEKEKGQIKTIIYLRESEQWHRLSKDGVDDHDIAENTLAVLENNITSTKNHCLFYDPSLKTWFCSYNPLSTKILALSIQSTATNLSIDEDYIKCLFQFYCHQLQMLQGSYRDALTGLYNRRAFNEKMVQLLEIPGSHSRRSIDYSPTIYAMLDIDHFKRINDKFGHLYGDEVLILFSNLMTESFRENDRLFRYGGEEFALVMMDIDVEQAKQSLERFRIKVARHKFANIDQVTISIGFTLFDRSQSMDDLIRMADTALYYCKNTTRNAVHSYNDLLDKGLISVVEGIDSTQIQKF